MACACSIYSFIEFSKLFIKLYTGSYYPSLAESPRSLSVSRVALSAVRCVDCSVLSTCGLRVPGAGGQHAAPRLDMNQC